MTHDFQEFLENLANNAYEFQQKSPVPTNVQLKNSKHVLTVGNSCTGKTKVAHAAGQYLKQNELAFYFFSKVMRTRPGGSMFFGFEELSSSGVIIARAVQSLLNTAKEKGKAFVVLDSPDESCDDNLSYAMGAYVAKTLNEHPDLGSYVSSSSKAFVKGYIANIECSPSVIVMDNTAENVIQWLNADIDNSMSFEDFIKRN